LRESLRIVIYEIVVPNLGATGGEVKLLEWLTPLNGAVTQGTPLFLVETDKADMEVEAFRSGYLRRLLVPTGTSVLPGTLIALLSDAPDEPLPEEGRQTKTSATSLETSTFKRGGPAFSPDEPIAFLLNAYRRMALIRRFEDHLHRLFLEGLVPGTLHQCQGQEAVAVGVCSTLRSDDVIFSTHRPVGHLLAKGASIRGIAAELWGKATGICGGKGGQMHLADSSVGAMPSNAIVGANIPQAVGAALGFRLRGSDRVAVSFFGDGAANIGAFHEGVNLAAVKNAPVLLVCENNQYAASTHMSLTFRISRIAERAAGYGIPGYTVDGMDFQAVYTAASDAVARARAGHGPTLLEFMTYRYAGHSRGDPGGYRSKEELAGWRSRDPLERMRRLLCEENGIPAGEIDGIEAECQAEVEEAVAFARSSPDADPASLYQAVYAERSA
jgi:pyruvate dehydrogenase E1 component alpha subunit